MALRLTNERYLNELACVEALIARIVSTIEKCEPIYEEWRVAQDAFCVMSNRLVFPRPQHPPTPVVEQFHASRVNPSQLAASRAQLDRLSMGGILLLEDAAEWFSKAAFGAGPVSQTYGRIPASSTAAEGDGSQSSNNGEFSRQVDIFSLPRNLKALHTDHLMSILIGADTRSAGGSSGGVAVVDDVMHALSVTNIHESS
jgi:hypothetical protein